MTVKPTGHAEIDEQHAILDSIIGEASKFCNEAKRNPRISCSECNSHNWQKCAATLASSASELWSFLVGHNTYEEKMMELLPNTPQCQRHVKEHKRAHAAIARKLKILSASISKENPRVAGTQLLRIAKDWLGEHSLGFDQHLAHHLDSTGVAEIDFDGQLVAMLDEHVFHNRPTKTKSTASSAKALLRKKLEVRGRFESLSRAQRTVFWLVVGGSTNKQIGSELGISVNTIKSHRAAIFQKMEVKTALELVKKADVLR